MQTQSECKDKAHHGNSNVCRLKDQWKEVRLSSWAPQCSLLGINECIFVQSLSSFRVTKCCVQPPPMPLPWKHPGMLAFSSYHRQSMNLSGRNKTHSSANHTAHLSPICKQQCKEIWPRLRPRNKESVTFRRSADPPTLKERGTGERQRDGEIKNERGKKECNGLVCWQGPVVGEWIKKELFTSSCTMSASCRGKTLG